MKTLIRKRVYGLLSATAIALSGGCGGPDIDRITIVSTNDIHAAIDRFPRLATLVDSLRTLDPEGFLLVDAGDRWTGNPFVDHAPEPGKPMIELANRIGYDAATIGNHEFDFGPVLLDRRIREADFPVVVANLLTDTTPLTQPAPYAILEAGGRRVALLGLVSNFANGHPDGKEELYAGMTFPSPYGTAETFRSLKDSADLFVVLSHLGDAADSILAARVPEIDLIIGGHTHVALPEARRYGNTLVTQTGTKLRYAGVTTVVFEDGLLASIENRLIDLDTIRPDSTFQRMVDTYNNDPALRTVIGINAEDLDRQGIANLTTDIVRAATDAQVAFYHSSGLRADHLPAGDLIEAELFRIEPFGNRIHTLYMTPEQIRELIVNKYNDAAEPAESRRPDIYPSGFTYTILLNELGEAVDVRFDGLPDDERLLVAMPEYMYLMYDFDKAPVLESEAEAPLLTDLMRRWFAERSPVVGDNTPRMTVEYR